MNQAESIAEVRGGWMIYFRLPITTTEPLNDWLAENIKDAFDVRYGAVMFKSKEDASLCYLRWR
jgi:hypothetical protein